MSGIRLESVSIGKGTVTWRVVYPHLARKNRNLEREYGELGEACVALKRFLDRDELDPKTAALVEEHAPEGAWGSEASAGASSAS